jgi:hypothetical protein
MIGISGDRLALAYHRNTPGVDRQRSPEKYRCGGSNVQTISRAGHRSYFLDRVHTPALSANGWRAD